MVDCCSCELDLNLDGLLETIWEYLALVRIFTKKRGCESFFLFLPVNAPRKALAECLDCLVFVSVVVRVCE